ncbi:hemolysin III family protein [Alkalibacter rhizosphaerae]|uniref:Hemolysin III family protein n=1 Tax=Alkalibacter rhizosphaerae TaxID=2815577 RepID=A0A974XDE0_9FIRM|nr:hemolysin III family protein [Alkalibacter rhizosphaerae]QSX07787.1 hemolysin III family protein [Alkalibacter rhizosphaerae]
MEKYFREPHNTLTHLTGLILAVIGSILLWLRAAQDPHPMALPGALVFAAGLMGLYFASSYYHGKFAPEPVLIRLRKLDHVMIFFLIAASYTPICLMVLPAPLGRNLLGVIWILAIAGMIVKMFFINVPRWVSTGLYLFLGWASVAVIKPLYQLLPKPGFGLLVAGGLFYTVGAVIYGSKSKALKIGPYGYHEIFHLFILAGSLSHYILVYYFIY